MERAEEKDSGNKKKSFKKIEIEKGADFWFLDLCKNYIENSFKVKAISIGYRYHMYPARPYMNIAVSLPELSSHKWYNIEKEKWELLSEQVWYDTQNICILPDNLVAIAVALDKDCKEGRDAIRTKFFNPQELVEIIDFYQKFSINKASKKISSFKLENVINNVFLCIPFDKDFLFFDIEAIKKLGIDDILYNYKDIFKRRKKCQVPIFNKFNIIEKKLKGSELQYTIKKKIYLLWRGEFDFYYF